MKKKPNKFHQDSLYKIHGSLYFSVIALFILRQ